MDDLTTDSKHALNLKPMSFVIGPITIRPDGSVEIKEGVATDDAARHFWTTFVGMAPGFLNATRSPYPDWPVDRMTEALTAIYEGERMRFPRGEEAMARRHGLLLELARIGLMTLQEASPAPHPQQNHQDDDSSNSG